MDQAGANGNDIVGMLEQAAGVTRGIIANVRPDQWTTPSPCAGWTVRDVVRHLVEGGETMATAAAGACLVPQGDLLGDDPAAAFAASSIHLVEAIRTPGVLEGTVEMPYGVMPGRMVAGFGLVDALVHGWDIARATGQRTDFAPELNEAALTLARQTMTGFDRASSEAFGPEQPAPLGASAADRLAAFLGRTV
jgi:uncharacterized protein (TIGR03086 family)